MLNHITIMGRLTRDPELRRTGSGIAVASFTVAVDRDFGGRDGGEHLGDLRSHDTGDGADVGGAALGLIPGRSGFRTQSPVYNLTVQKAYE